MSISKELAKEEGVLPYLKLATQILDEDGKKKGVKGTGQHKVRFVSDEKIEGVEYGTGNKREEIKYIFEEDGEQKQYRVPVRNDQGELHYFIQRISEFKQGDELILEYKKIPGSFKGYINIRLASGEVIGKEEQKTEPVIDEDGFVVEEKSPEKEDYNPPSTKEDGSVPEEDLPPF